MWRHERTFHNFALPKPHCSIYLFNSQTDTLCKPQIKSVTLWNVLLPFLTHGKHGFSKSVTSITFESKIWHILNFSFQKLTRGKGLNSKSLTCLRILISKCENIFFQFMIWPWKKLYFRIWQDINICFWKPDLFSKKGIKFWRVAKFPYQKSHR